MEFSPLSSPKQAFYLTLMTCVNEADAKRFDADDNLVFLNPNYIVSSFHIMQGVNRACYNFSINKTKSKSLKKEIIHSLTNCGKLNDSLALHSIEENKENNYYILFILNSNINEIKAILNDIKGNEISSVNYSKLINFDALIKAFAINQCEIDDDCENGIFAAIYNKISTKDLK